LKQNFTDFYKYYTEYENTNPQLNSLEYMSTVSKRSKE